MTTARIGETGTWWSEDDRGLLWADDGRTALQEAATRELAEQYVRFYEQEGLFWCTGHDRWEPKPHAFRRYAGLMCQEAADDYKKNNQRECRICGRPLWDCYC